MEDLIKLSTIDEALNWKWEDIAPLYTTLEKTTFTESTVAGWMRQWTAVSDVCDELYNRLYAATTVNTADKRAEQKFTHFMEKIYPQMMTAEQKLKEKLLASGVSIPGFEIPLRNMRAEADIFREENLPLLVEEENL